jgi:hypothetical protein
VPDDRVGQVGEADVEVCFENNMNPFHLGTLLRAISGVNCQTELAVQVDRISILESTYASISFE